MGERVALPPGMSGIFDDGGFLDKALNTVDKVSQGAQQAADAYRQVSAGNAKVTIQPTAQGIQQSVATAVSSYTPLLITGAIGLAVLLLMRRK